VQNCVLPRGVWSTFGGEGHVDLGGLDIPPFKPDRLACCSGTGPCCSRPAVCVAFVFQMSWDREYTMLRLFAFQVEDCPRR
jgi:hypothetical protein